MTRRGLGNQREASEVSRRNFLRAGAGVGSLATLGLTLTGRRAVAVSPGRSADRAVILLLLVGGPSQLETWDPKPDAPAEVRGPFRSIATSVPGVRVSEHLPKLARRMDRLTLIRSLHHEEAPIHETGFQLLQTGRVRRPGEEAPHAGAVAARVLGARGAAAPFVILPGLVGNTGVGISHGQGAGLLGPAFEPANGPGEPVAALDLEREPLSVRDRYGRNPFGENCLRARRLVEAGSRFVTVNMVQTVFHAVSWDCHGSRPFSTLEDYRRELLPAFDTAFSALIDDLARSGRLDSTLLVAAGEFGRTPKINASGGRDHWPGVWSVALAGGGTAGGRVIGASDPTASEPADRPVSLPELHATILRSLDLDPTRTITLADGSRMPLGAAAKAVEEAFA